MQGGVRVGGVYNIELENGASEYPGDYLYRSGSLRWDVESGMWGIFRVMKKGVRYCCQCACRTLGISQEMTVKLTGISLTPKQENQHKAVYFQ